MFVKRHNKILLLNYTNLLKIRILIDFIAINKVEK